MGEVGSAILTFPQTQAEPAAKITTSVLGQAALEAFLNGYSDGFRFILDIANLHELAQDSFKIGIEVDVELRHLYIVLYRTQGIPFDVRTPTSASGRRTPTGVRSDCWGITITG